MRNLVSRKHPESQHVPDVRCNSRIAKDGVLEVGCRYSRLDGQRKEVDDFLGVRAQ